MKSIKSCGLTGREDCRDPTQSLVGGSGVALPLVWAGPSQLRESDAEGFPFWDYDGMRRQAEMEPFLAEKSRTDCALIEEASRYGCVPIPCGLMAFGLFPSSLFFFGRTSLGDFCDISGDDRVTHLRETPLRMLLPLGPPEEENACRWDLREGPSDCKDSSGKELRLAQSMPRDGKGWEEESWEESELAKFSKFLGFSTEGLEKEILEFLIKIRKRREKVHSKNLLEKSKFERELKRLECSINYEGGEEAEEWNDSRRVSDYGGQMKLRILSWNVWGANDSSKRKVIKVMIRSQRVDLFCLQETKIQAMTEGLVRSLGTGRFLNWGTLDAQGSAGGILICWDKRTLEVMEMEVGSFSISCRMRNVEDGLVWMFTGVYGPFSREEREWMWEEIGAIRGIWEDPWCLGGDFNVTLSLRERSN